MSKEKTPIKDNTVTISVEYFKELKQTSEGFKEAIEEAYTRGAIMGTPSKGIAKQYYKDRYGK